MKFITSTFGISSKRVTAATAAAVFLALFAHESAAATRPALSLAIDRIIARPALSRALFGVEFYDLDSKRVVYAYNAHKIFKAASTTKLVTEGTSLALFGPDYRFHTRAYGTGPLDAAGTLHGDIIVVAAGDPNLSNRMLPDGTLAFQNEDHSYDGSPDTKAVSGDPLAALRDIAKQISAKGIHRISGHVAVDTSLFPQGEVEGGTGVTISPIVVNDNIIDVVVTPGAHIGEPTTIAVSPLTAYASFTNASKTGSASSDRSITFSGDVEDARGDRTITVGGTLPAGSRPILYAYAVPSPRRFAESGLTQVLRDAGVATSALDTPADPVPASASAFYTPANLIADHVSAPLSEDMKVTLKVSDNLHASMQPYLWGALAAQAKSDYLTAGFAKERTFLSRAGLDLHGADQSDGLGDAGSFAPDFMVSYLRFMTTQPHFAVFERALPVLGVDGTLFNIQNGTPGAGHVHAKTGTWTQGDRLNTGTLVTAKGLAGYMTTRSGRHLAFCAYLNNFFVKHNADPAGEGHVAGQILGEIANAAYLYVP